jgi:hypothetical protein
MSFDEQPDGDPHGECAAEIARLAAELLIIKQGYVRASQSVQEAQARIEYLEGALRVIAEGTICPDLFPNDTDENVIAAKTAMVTAIAALEHSQP